MTDGQAQRVGGVRGPRRVGQPEQPGHHDGHLGLLRPPAAGHRGLHLAGGIGGHRQAAARGAHDGHRAGVGGAHHGAYVVLAEHPLHRDRVGPVLAEPAFYLLLQGEQCSKCGC